MKSIIDEIYSVMINEKKEFSEAQILKEFFKIDFDDRDMAKKIVEPLLTSDARFKQTTPRTWTAVKRIALEELSLDEVPFVLFYIEDLERVKRPKGFLEKDLFTLLKEYSSFLFYRGGMVEYEFNVKDSLKNLGKFVFVPYDRRSLGSLRRLYRVISPLEPDMRTLSIGSLISVLYPGKKLKTWDDIIKEFRLQSVHSENPASKTKTLRSILEYVLDTVRERGITCAGELLELALQGKKKVDLSKYAFDRDFLRDIPEMPGVYLFFNRKEELLYVGKTNNLKQRINSYFWNTGESEDKIRGILEGLHRIEYRVLGSDLEALLEEYSLIHEAKPQFNKMVNIPKREVSIADTVLLLPSKVEGYIRLYFLSERIPLIGYDFDCAGENPGVNDILKTIKNAQESVFDPLKIIALFYLRRYEERLNRIDMDRYATAQDVVDSLRMHCRDPQGVAVERTTYI
ncbi:MAG: hypothetical protein AMS17_07680 [Spirochaetes bacterium DG_61]|jgi:hypothetical protein|nr:MAG: hypothetical protein AMS17_07680 [Spirochaetes bacterium DG_61]